MLKEAIYYSKYHSVIPIGIDKKPLISWKEYQERKATEEEIKEWFKLYPDMQIGIVTGKISNLIVVDIDEPIFPKWLPDTAIARTGSGGYHFYYIYSDKIGNSARIKENVDIRGDGGYVVAPPSRNQKGKYEWIKKRSLSSFPKNLFFKNETKKMGVSVSTEYDGCNKGGRNDAMTRYVGHILAKIHPSEWETIAWDLILNANQKNIPPLNEYELKNIFNSIKSKEEKNNTDRWYQKKEEKELDVWKDEEDDVMLLSEVAKRQAIKTESYSSGIRILDEATDGGFNDGDLIIVSAPTGNGKTSFAQTLTYHALVQALPCLWFSYEVLVSHLYDKFKNMGIGSDWLNYSPLKTSTGNLKWVLEKIKEGREKFGIKIVVIDHLGFLAPAFRSDISRNFSAYLGQVCRELKKIALDEEIIIILPVHMRKTDNPNINDIRDSSGIAQEADLVFTLSRELNADDNGEDYYTNYTKIVLAKNRKTGKSIKSWFYMKDDLFIHDSFYTPLEVSKKYKKKLNY